MAATNKSSIFDILYTNKSRDIKGVYSDSNEVNNINVIDAGSTRSVKIKLAKFKNLV